MTLQNPSAAYGEELTSLANEREDIVLVTADTSELMCLEEFAKVHPSRLYEVGIAEQAATNIAAGFATVGFTPFITTFAMFQVLRAGDNIRNGIAYPGMNVKIVSGNIALNVGKNGVTHHALEDIAFMRAIPNMIVVSPADAVATRKLVRQMADIKGPAYMRLDKIPIPTVYDQKEELTLGKGNVLVEGEDVVVFATGYTVHTALEAARVLQADGISAMVVDIHTIKPLDEELVLAAAKKTRAVVTVEPHSVIGGLGGAVCEYLSSTYPTLIERVGVCDVFTESGTAAELNAKYGLHSENIVNSARKVLERKLARI